MRISIEDYESRALDYVEGNLPADELPAFEAFLSEHPDLGREIRSMRGSAPVLPAEKWVYPDKKALLRGGIGVSVWLNRAGSFLGGMAAACLLIGVFVLVDRHDSSRDDALLARGIPAGQPEVERRQESASALVSKEPVEADVTEQAVSQKPSVYVRVASASPAQVPPVPESAAMRAAFVHERIDPVLSGEMARACRERVAPADLKDKPIAETIRSVPVALGSPDPQPDMWRYDDSRSMPAASFRDGRASEETATGGMRVLTSILAPLDRIIPIRTYRTENESGVEIISLIRIGNKNPKNNP
ncbi:hypothetical protein [Alistipes ihumii]|uniref:hypothetical protein n=1 Tax=Alistipes ihumii TaxID=1470347 RepID=UPI003AB4B21A